MRYIANRPIRISGRVFLTGEAIDRSMTDDETFDGWIRNKDIVPEEKAAEEPVKADEPGEDAVGAGEAKAEDGRKKKNRK